MRKIPDKIQNLYVTNQITVFSKGTKLFGRVPKRPTLFPMPAFAARLAFGEMADELLLASARVEPAKLISSNFQFQFPELEDGLRHVFGRVTSKESLNKLLKS